MQHIYQTIVEKCADHVLTDSGEFLRNLTDEQALPQIAEEYVSEAFENWDGESLVKFILSLSNDLYGVLNEPYLRTELLKEVD